MTRLAVLARRTAVVAGLTAVLASCVPGAADGQRYPDGCRDFDLSDALCALAIVRVAEGEAVDLAQVESIHLLGDPCPGPRCSAPVGLTFVVRVRFTMHDGSTPGGNAYCSHELPELCSAVETPRP